MQETAYHCNSQQPRGQNVVTTAEIPRIMTEVLRNVMRSGEYEEDSEVSPTQEHDSSSDEDEGMLCTGILILQ